MLGIGYYYFYSMGTVKTNINLTKVEDTNKIYTYDIYSDFYFRVSKYNSVGDVESEYTELQPLKTSIGFDLSNKSHTPIIKTIKGDKLILGEKDSEFVKRFRVMLQKFEKDFGAIVATQDSYIIKSSIESAKKIVKNLYDINLTKQNFKQNYYEEIKDLPIENMRIKHFKLDKIPQNEKKPLKIASNQKKEWQPNIIEWNFGEKDKIYMRYLIKWKNSDLEDFIAKNYKNKIVAKLVKINNNQLKKMYFININGQNRLDTLYMDANGYIYILTFEASNPKAFEKYISDYLKIAYGVYFVDIKGFDNWWAKEKVNFEKQNRLDKVNEIRGKLGLLVCNKVFDKYFGDRFLEFFKLKKYNEEVYSLDGQELVCAGIEDNNLFSDIVLTTKKVNLDKYYNYYKQDIFKDLEEGSANKTLLYEGVRHYDGIFTNGKEKIKELCPNGNIECIVKLQNSNWDSENITRISENSINTQSSSDNSFSNVYVWFVVEIDYANLGQDVLGFDCLTEDEIILTIGNYKYIHDQNEYTCSTEDLDKSEGASKFKYSLMWKKTNNIFELDTIYKVHVVEEDIFENDNYSGKDVVFTKDDIDIINSGKTLSKNIGNGYYIYFSK